MSDTSQTAYYQLSLNILKALGGDTSIPFPDADAIWTEIYKIYDVKGGSYDIESLKLDVLENGLYIFNSTDSIDAYAPVSVNVNVPQKYTDEEVQRREEEKRAEGYESGKTDGYNDGIIEGKEIGYSDGYVVGRVDGIDYQKSKLTELSVTENGVYSTEDGYNTVTVEVPTSETEPADLRDLVVEVDENKNYEFLPTDYDGWKSVNLTVNVPTSGGSGKPKIPNGFRLTESDTAYIWYTRLKEIDFSQYDWSDVYDMSYFFAGFKSDIGASIGWSVNDFNNFIENFNGKMLSMRYMFSSSGYTSLLALPNFGSLTNGCQDMGLLCDGATKLTSTANISSWDTSSVLITQGMFRGCSKLTSVAPFDTSKVLDARDMFYGCSKLATIPEFNTSNMRDVARMFYNCTALTSIPNLDFSNVSEIGQLFYGCSKLGEIPNMNFRYVSQFTGNDSTSSSNSWINGCTTLQTIGVIDSDNITNFNYAFGGGANAKIINFGGFRNLGKKYNVTNTNTNYGFLLAPNLTYESLLNVINELYDRASVGYPILTLKMHSNHMALLSEDDIARATAKGWTLSA